MLIHHFNSETGEYVSSSLADADPMNEGRWILPAFATTEPLPERQRYQWPFWRDGEWVLLPDHRGRVLYRTANGEPAELTMAGVTPEDAELTDKPRPSDEYVWQDGNWEVDPAVLAVKKRESAMLAFEALYAEARRNTLGRESAYAAGLLDVTAAATFRAWSLYQMRLVDVVNDPEFPDKCEWPAKPDAASIRLIAEGMEKQRDEIEAMKATVTETARADVDPGETKDASASHLPDDSDIAR